MRYPVKNSTLELSNGVGGRYNALNYVLRDPIVQRLQEDRCTFTWAEAYASCKSAYDVKIIKGEASEFGLRIGYVVPILTLNRMSLAFRSEVSNRRSVPTGLECSPL